MEAIVIGFIENYTAKNSLRKFAVKACRNGAYLACADGGGNIALEWDLDPQLLIGDMDSIKPEALEKFKVRQGVEINIHPEQKDETDLELALYTSLDRGATEITILGGLGGRLDHTMGNLYLLAAPRLLSSKAKIRILDEREAVYLLQGGNSLTLEGQPNDIVSLFPIGGNAFGITTKNLYYPLENETLVIGPSRGVSNRITANPAEVKLESGLLLAVHNLS